MSLLVACQAPPTPIPPTMISGAQDGQLTLTITPTLVRQDSVGLYHVLFNNSEITKLVVGLFDRGTAPPSLGYFNDNGAGNSTTNPLTAAQYTALQAALGGIVSVGGASKSDLRRYLFRTHNAPVTTRPPAVVLTNFPNLSAGHAYNAFVCALDSYDAVIGFNEVDLTAAMVTAQAVPVSINLNYGGLGGFSVTNTPTGTAMDPLSAITHLIVGVFDTSASPQVGWLNDGTTNAAFTGNVAYWTELKAMVVGGGFSAAQAAVTNRYLIRQYAAPITSVLVTTAITNLPLGTRYRPFLMAVRGNSVDAGHTFIATDSTAVAGSSTGTPLGFFLTSLVQTFAGSLSGGSDGTGIGAQFSGPTSGAFDSSDNFYVADTANHTIRKITPAGVVTTYAGLAGSAGLTEGVGGLARFSSPTGVALDASGIVYVADSGNHSIRMIATNQQTSTLAGVSGTFGSADAAVGPGSLARFNTPKGIAVDGSDVLYVADTGNNTVRKVTLGGVVTTLAGTAGVSGYLENTGALAQFRSPEGIASTPGGTLYVADTANHVIRGITGAGVTSFIAGQVLVAGASDGAGALGAFSSPRGIAVDASTNLYVADTGNHTVRKITSGTVATVAGAAGSLGNSDGVALSSRFSGSKGVVMDASSSVIVVDTANHRIRKLQ